ncbi:MAG: glycerate kinase [Bacteroidales bacterium]
MNILIAPNSLKDAANAAEIADAIEAGIARSQPGMQIRKMPIADGGEYTLEILLNATGGKIVETETVDPLGRAISAAYGITSDHTAIIELSQASGIALLSGKEKQPLHTSTYGTGLQIRDALERGCRNILLTLGGSATVDGGSGILSALGIGLFDKNGRELPRGGGNLIILESIDLSAMAEGLKESSFTILCDVDNPLLGEKGAAMVFAPQKGAGAMETMVLERCLANFADKCEAFSGKNLVNMEGAGAAGGVPVGIKSFFKTTIIQGTEYILNLLEADKQIKWANVIITAEGSLDSQTFGGKAPSVLAGKGKAEGKMVICIAGRVPHRFDQPDNLFDAVFSLQNQPMSLEESIENTLSNITNTAFEIGRLLGTVPQ